MSLSLFFGLTILLPCSSHCLVSFAVNFVGWLENMCLLLKIRHFLCVLLKFLYAKVFGAHFHNLCLVFFFVNFGWSWCFVLPLFAYIVSIYLLYRITISYLSCFLLVCLTFPFLFQWLSRKFSFWCFGISPSFIMYVPS